MRAAIHRDPSPAIPQGLANIARSYTLYMRGLRYP
jgi:hypothetical protein